MGAKWFLKAVNLPSLKGLIGNPLEGAGIYIYIIHHIYIYIIHHIYILYIIYIYIIHHIYIYYTSYIYIHRGSTKSSTAVSLSLRLDLAIFTFPGG